MSLLAVSLFLLQSHWKDVISLVSEPCQPGPAGPPQPSKGRKGRGVTPWGGVWAGGGCRGAAGLFLPRGSLRGTGGTEGAKPTRGAKGSGRGRPSRGSPQRGVCGRDGQGDRSQHCCSQRAPPDQQAGPVEAARTPAPAFPAWLRAAHSPDPQAPRALTWGHWGCGPSSAAGF